MATEVFHLLLLNKIGIFINSIVPLGLDFQRGDFNDVHVLDLDTWKWRAVATSGDVRTFSSVY